MTVLDRRPQRPQGLPPGTKVWRIYMLNGDVQERLSTAFDCDADELVLRDYFAARLIREVITYDPATQQVSPPSSWIRKEA